MVERRKWVATRGEGATLGRWLVQYLECGWYARFLEGDNSTFEAQSGQIGIGT